MAQHDIYTGKAIGNYRIQRKIASGSFGTVYRASHLHLPRTVVIKILHAVHLGSDEQKAQFLREAQILEMLKGLGNILPMLDFGIEGDIPYMVIEYAEGGSLRLLMQRENTPLPLEKVLPIIEQVGHGLEHAHSQGIVHRDLKPENILFRARSEALLADFGLSIILSTASFKHTHVAGTPAYMAPEQFRGQICKESDQYALACIAYELLTGHRLFDAPDFLSMGYCHAYEAPVPPRQHNPQIPVLVEQALLKALSKQRTERYPSVSAFVAALTHQTPAIAPANTAGKEPHPRGGSDNGEGTLPSLSGQSIPTPLPSTSPDPAGKEPSSIPSPLPIVPDVTPIPQSTGNTTQVLPPSETEGVATPSFATPPLSTPNNSTGHAVITEAMGIITGEAVGDTLSGTGKTPAAPPRPPPNMDKISARNAGTTNALRLASSAGWSPHNSSGEGSPRGAQTANRNRCAIRLVALFVILTLFVGGALTISANPGVVSTVGRTLGVNATTAATVTITPLSKTEQDTYVLQGINGSSNIANRQVGMRQLTSTKTDTKQVTLTHFHQDGTSATGSITFLNFDTNNAQTVTKATVTFNLGNVQIALDQDITIPKGTLVGTTVQAGKATVSAHAVQPGTAGNIAALAINQSPCCGSTMLVAQNPNAFTGGTDVVDYNYLKPADVNAVTSADQGPLKSRTQNAITGQKKANEQLLGDIHCDDTPKGTSSVTPGVAVQATTASVTVSVTCSAEVYDANAAQTIAQNNLTLEANKDPQLGSEPMLAGTIATQTLPQTQPDGSTTFSVKASGLWYYNWTDAGKQALLNSIKGKTKVQAKTILNSTAGISNATVVINNGGTTLPTDVSQIAFKTNVPTGPSGGSNQTPASAGSTPTPTH